MRVELFALCDFAQDVHGKLTVVGAFDTIVAPQVPVTHPFMCLAGRFRFQAHELGEHRVRIEFLDPRGRGFIQAMEQTLHFSELVDDTGALSLVLQLQSCPFKEWGKHLVRLFLDGQEAATLPLYLRKPRH